MFATTFPPPQRLLVFARLPELGRVKTRLAASIGDERALAVYRAMLQDLLAGIGSGSPEMEIECMWAPSEHANGAALRAAFGGHSVAMQTGDTLGDRLAMAFSERFFFHRTMKIIAIGVDDPALSRETIDHAFSLLDSVEWIVGPADDGGYYLIGCRAAAFDTEVFQGIEWGTSSVLASTLAKVRERNATVALLPRRLDIDEEKDLHAYQPAEKGALAMLLEGWGAA